MFLIHIIQKSHNSHMPETQLRTLCFCVLVRGIILPKTLKNYSRFKINLLQTTVTNTSSSDDHRVTIRLLTSCLIRNTGLPANFFSISCRSWTNSYLSRDALCKAKETLHTTDTKMIQASIIIHTLSLLLL